MPSVSQYMSARQRVRLDILPLSAPQAWAERQPPKWRNACRAFVAASNTPGGVVGKNLPAIVREANEAGIKISLRTFERHIPVLQAYGVIYLDESAPFYRPERGDFVQKASTWILRLSRTMPPGVLATSTERVESDSIGEWITRHGCRETIADYLAAVAMQPACLPF